MKKSVFGSLFFVFVSGQSWALSDLEITGELDVSASVNYLPTGERGDSAFNIPSLFLNLNVPLQRDNVLVLNIEGSEQKSTSADRFDLGMRSAYLDLVSPFKGMHALRVGLVPQVWQEAQYEDMNYRFLGKTAWAITEKWKYLSHSDLGLSYMSEMPQSLGEWALSFTNGEGAESGEIGSHKEVSVFARFFRASPLTVSVNYVRGNYEVYGDEVGVKERGQLLVSYAKEDFYSVGLELLYARDPADAITAFEMADGVDVTEWSGASVDGYAASLFTLVQVGAKSEILFRIDHLTAKAGAPGKEMQMGLLAYGFRLEEDIKLAAAVDYSLYGENYGLGIRDSSKIELAAQVLF